VRGKGSQEQHPACLQEDLVRNPRSRVYLIQSFLTGFSIQLADSTVDSTVSSCSPLSEIEGQGPGGRAGPGTQGRVLHGPGWEQEHAERAPDRRGGAYGRNQQTSGDHKGRGQEGLVQGHQPEGGRGEQEGRGQGQGQGQRGGQGGSGGRRGEGEGEGEGVGEGRCSPWVCRGTRALQA